MSEMDSRTGVLERRDGMDVLRFERRLAHPVERVWAALTDPDALRGWWGAADELELVEGGRFTLRWLNTDLDGNGAVMHATITALDPPWLLETSGDLHGVLRWELRPDGDGTLLIFTSTLHLPAEYRSKTMAGWHFHLDALADALGGRPFDWATWATDGMARWDAIHRTYLAPVS